MNAAVDWMSTKKLWLTQNLAELRSWLQSQQVTHVAMASTGVLILEQDDALQFPEREPMTPTDQPDTVAFVPVREEFLDGIFVARDDRSIHLSSEIPLTILSSTVMGADVGTARHILNMNVVSNYECGPHFRDLRECASALGITEPFVGMLTAAPLRYGQIVVERNPAASVLVVLTLGISHPAAAGVTPAVAPRHEVGTINTIIVVDAALPIGARVNLVTTATEAKSLALVEANIRAPHGGYASGTVTDAIVLATTERGNFFEYGGPISPMGGLVGRAVRRGMQQALQARGFLAAPSNG